MKNKLPVYLLVRVIVAKSFFYCAQRLNYLRSQQLLPSRFNVSTFQRIATAKRNSSTRYSSLLGQCLRLVSCVTGVLPHLRLRAFHRQSSLPSLCYRTAGNSVAGHETPAANHCAGRGGVKRSRLLDLLSLTKRR
jgi:hypothetical protein